MVPLTEWYPSATDPHTVKLTDPDTDRQTSFRSKMTRNDAGYWVHTQSKGVVRIDGDPRRRHYTQKTQETRRPRDRQSLDTTKN